MIGPSPRLHFGVFEIDVKAGEVWKHGRRIRLQEQPYRVLLALLEAPGETVTRQELRERLWPAETFVDFDNGLNNVINRLRGALGDSATSPRLIETVGRRGYRFIGEVRHPAHVASASDQPVQADSHASDAPDAEAASDVMSGAAAPGETAPPLITSIPTAGSSAILATSPDRPLIRSSRLGASLFAAAVILLAAVSLAGPTRLSLWLSGTGLGTSVSASPGIRGLGVLPLADPATPRGDLFAYGMVNAVITELSRFQALKVVSPASESDREQAGRPTRDVARELDVDTLLRGSVTRNGDRLGVRLELIDAASGEQVWARTFERAAADRLALRSEIVRDVVQQVQARLTPAVEAPAPERVTGNPRAYEAYLRGQFETLRRNPAAFAVGSPGTELEFAL